MENSQYTFKETNCDVCGSWDSEELIKITGNAYHRCVNCGLIYSQPMIENITENNEESISHKLVQYASKITTFQKRNRKKIHGLLRYRQNGNFLEIGSNTGALLDVARSIGWNVKGVDLSMSACAYARKNLGLDVFTGTIEQAAFPEGYFDVVFTNATLEHLRHPLSTLKESCRVLREGGVFFADTVNWDSYTRRIYGAKWKLLDPTGHLHLYTPENIQSLCRYAGLELVKVWTTGVRSGPNVPDNKRFRWMNICKGPLSVLTRITKKGDSIKFIARKPSLNPAH